MARPARVRSPGAARSPGSFAWRLNTNAALGALVSSKVNQWTLLVGSLPIVFAISSSILHGLPLDSLQREELFLTAAQSAFAVAVLANRSISVKEAYVLLGLFLSQFVLGAVLPEDVRELERIAVGIVYLVLAAVHHRPPTRRRSGRCCATGSEPRSPSSRRVTSPRPEPRVTG